MVHEDIKDTLIKELLVQIENFYGKSPKSSADYSKIITTFHTQRLVGLLDSNDHKGKVANFIIYKRYLEDNLMSINAILLQP